MLAQIQAGLQPPAPRCGGSRIGEPARQRSLSLQGVNPIKDPARFPWHEVKKIEHYRLDVNAMTQPMVLKEDAPAYGGEK
jgi:hypothetical protein